MTELSKSDMVAARDALEGVLDSRFKNVPEWRAYVNLVKLLAADPEGTKAPRFNQISAVAPVNAESAHTPVSRLVPKPYVMLVLDALVEAGEPLPTPDLIESISKRRDLGPDLEKAKVNVTSALSKDNRFKSVPWSGGRAWWFADRPVPNRLERIISR